MSDRAKYWQRLVAAWEESGLSQAEFCRRRDVSAGSFAWWKRRLGGTAKQARKRVGRNADRSPSRKHANFAEVALPKSAFPVDSTPAPATPVEMSGYEIALNGGRVIRLPHNFDPVVVAQLVGAMESC
jgi:hypothetical protein